MSKETGKHKRINRATIFLACLMFLYLSVELISAYTGWLEHITMLQNILISQGIIFIPTILFFVITKQNFRETVRLNKMHVGTYFIIPLLVLCIEPVMTVGNAISMLFVKNYISAAATQVVTGYSYLTAMGLMALTPAIVEELAYRGVILGNYRRTDTLGGILMSGFLFGLLHMNFNQFAYAVILGIIFGIVVEASGSIIATMEMHFLINGLSVSLSYLLQLFYNLPGSQGYLQESESAITDEYLWQVIRVYGKVAVVALVFAGLLIYAIAAINNRKDNLKNIFRGRSRRSEKNPVDGGAFTGGAVDDDTFGSSVCGVEASPRIISPMLIIVIVLCIAKCIFDEFIM